jgi:hypothetical protein
MQPFSHLCGMIKEDKAWLESCHQNSEKEDKKWDYTIWAKRFG